MVTGTTKKNINSFQKYARQRSQNNNSVENQKRLFNIPDEEMCLSGTDYNDMMVTYPGHIHTCNDANTNNYLLTEGASDDLSPGGNSVDNDSARNGMVLDSETETEFNVSLGDAAAFHSIADGVYVHDGTTHMNNTASVVTAAPTNYSKDILVQTHLDNIIEFGKTTNSFQDGVANILPIDDVYQEEAVLETKTLQIHQEEKSDEGYSRIMCDTNTAQLAAALEADVYEFNIKVRQLVQGIVNEAAETVSRILDNEAIVTTDPTSGIVNYKEGGEIDKGNCPSTTLHTTHVEQSSTHLQLSATGTSIINKNTGMTLDDEYNQTDLTYTEPQSVSMSDDVTNDVTKQRRSSPYSSVFNLIRRMSSGKVTPISDDLDDYEA